MQFNEDLDRQGRVYEWRIRSPLPCSYLEKWWNDGARSHVWNRDRNHIIEGWSRRERDTLQPLHHILLEETPSTSLDPASFPSPEPPQYQNKLVSFGHPRSKGCVLQSSQRVALQGSSHQAELLKTLVRKSPKWGLPRMSTGWNEVDDFNSFHFPVSHGGSCKPSIGHSAPNVHPRS